jgi:hypothetical protein
MDIQKLVSETGVQLLAFLDRWLNHADNKSDGLHITSIMKLLSVRHGKAPNVESVLYALVPRQWIKMSTRYVESTSKIGLRTLR